MAFFSKIIEKAKSRKSIHNQIAKTTQIAKVDNTKFDSGLRKTSNFFKNAFNEIVRSNQVVDENIIEAIEDQLIQFDIGSLATSKILQAIKEEIKEQNISDSELVKEIVIDKLFLYYLQDAQIDSGFNLKRNEMNVILVSGVNGVGKTTSIAKIAKYLLNDGYTVSLIAADTFRAGAVEQLKIWGSRLNINVTEPQKTGQDPTSVVYTGLEWAKENGVEVVICDTSGRLQNKINLMNELAKTKKIIKKFAPTQPCESLLVLDATMGQSGLSQAKAFDEAADLTGIVLTKMDSTSRGGIILAIKDIYNLPVKFIGLGEKMDDLQPFDVVSFITSITNSL